MRRDSLSLDIVLDPAATRSWQAALVRRLAAMGHEVEARHAPGAPVVSGLEALLALEATLFRLATDRPSGLAGSPGIPGGAGKRPAGRRIDLTGRPGEEPALVPLYDGSPDPAAAVAALAAGRRPILAVAAFPERRIVVSGEAANENPRLLTIGIDQVFSRMADLVVKALDHDEAVTGLAPPPARRAGTGTLAAFLVAGLAARIGSRLTRLARGEARWRVGWRRIAGDALADREAWPEAPYTWLPDDPERYFADPFVVPCEDGAAHVFVEDFPYATGIGRLAVFTLDRDGRAGPVRPILETGSHLSYPQVFRHEGAWWMLPEAGASGDLTLYRAEAFPDRWTPAARLIEGVALADATLVRHEGRWWLFATDASPGGSSWDALHLFHADDLVGPWTAHRQNPVIVDPASARPAGAMWRRGETLMRVAQDCRSGYGAGLAFARVERLDPHDYRQTVTSILAPPPHWRAGGAHTLNSGAGYEVIDALLERDPPAGAA